MAMLPRCADFASAVVTDQFDDMINPPGLTDRVLVVQADHDVLALRSLSAPPIGQGELIMAQLILDGRLARSHGQIVDVVWRPDRIERTTTIDGWRIETVTVCAPGRQSVVVDIAVTNLSEARREVALGVVPVSGVTAATSPWRESVAPIAENTQRLIRGERGIEASYGTDEARSAFCLQGFSTPMASAGQRIETVLSAGPGESARTAYVAVIGQIADGSRHDRALPDGAPHHSEYLDALSTFRELSADPAHAVVGAETFWDETLASLFSEGGTFDGQLPILETSNAALQTLYLWGAMGVAYFLRENPASVLGRTYDTLMPRYWQTTTFIWDYSLSSHVHAQLDPATMRRHIEHWVGLDIHSHFGTEWLSGGPAGYWYSVNDFAMIRLVHDYVRFTGDYAFLDHTLEVRGVERRMIDLVDEWAYAWQGLRNGSFLADYGGIDNLLECVSTYVHEVAGLNAANVWCLRTAAALHELRGESEVAARQRADADELLGHVLELYRPGDGFFNARMPGINGTDGELIPTRHCYDLATVGVTIGAELDATIQSEMADFFVRELRTPSWLRALSPWDDNAGYSLRPDHQWNGAYPAWPADVARGLVQMGQVDSVVGWLDGLARTTRQGPCGQAYFVEEAAPTIAGGARKSPPQFPYLIDWACSSSGAWVQFVVEGLFGVEVDISGTVTAIGHLESIDPMARLRGFRVAGRVYDIAADGTVSDGSATSGTVTDTAVTEDAMTRSTDGVVDPAGKMLA